VICGAIHRSEVYKLEQYLGDVALLHLLNKKYAWLLSVKLCMPLRLFNIHGHVMTFELKLNQSVNIRHKMHY